MNDFNEKLTKQYAQYASAALQALISRGEDLPINKVEERHPNQVEMRRRNAVKKAFDFADAMMDEHRNRSDKREDEIAEEQHELAQAIERRVGQN